MLILHLAGAGEPTALFTSENGRETTLRSPRPGRQVAMPSGWLDMAVDPASRRAFDAYVDQVGAQVQHSQPLLIKSLLTRMEWAGLSPGPWMAVKQVCMERRLSRTTVYRLRKDGCLKPGIHYLRTTPGRTSRTLWCPEAIRQAMADRSA